jgi:hypothetical protein
MAGTKFLEVEGGLARLVTRQVHYEVPLADLAPDLMITKPVTLPTLGRSQVFAHFDGSNPANKKLFCLAEIGPGIKNIRKVDRRYRLAMPWTYLWFVATTDQDIESNAWALETYHCYHARERHNGLDTQMIVARLPNVYGNGRICWGATGASPMLSLADRIDEHANNWYLSPFNRDLDGEVPLPYGEQTFRRWVEESQADPNCWQRWPEWTNTTPKITVRQLLAQHGVTPAVEEITLPRYIPNRTGEYTFGQWEDWFQHNVTPEQRARARVALENMRADNIENVPDLPPDPDDDGGVPVDFSLEPRLGR